MSEQLVQRLATLFLDDHPAEAAAFLESLPAEEAVGLLRGVAPSCAARVLQSMEPSVTASCVGALPAEPAADTLKELPLATTAGVLRRLEDEQAGAILSALPDDVARALRRILSFPRDTAGTLMDPRVIALPKDLRVHEALEHIRLRPQFALYYVYVIDREQRLHGVANVRELFLADPEQPLAAVMKAPVARLRADAGRSMVLEHPAWALYHALPVVDAEGRFLGAIRYETLRQLEAEATSPGGAADPLEAALDLGELFWIVTAGVISGFAAAESGGRGNRHG